MPLTPRRRTPRTHELLAELVLEVRGLRDEVRTVSATLAVLESRLNLLEASRPEAPKE